MAFLLPPSVKQRLLRFALSKVDLIDDTAIDLDKFNFSWGRTSVITLPKVPLKAAKLTSFLPLPPNFQVGEAYVNDLRITVPANLQGVSIDTSGIVVKGKLSQDGDEDASHTRHTSAKGTGSDAIPTAEDLAKSFIQEESAEERRQLEAAIHSQSQHLHQDPFTGSSVYSDDVDESELGMGVGLTVPDYLTNYLHLMEDTVQLSVGDIELHVETEIPSEGWEDDEPVQADLVIHIGGIEVEGLTVGGPEAPFSPEQQSQTRPGKRKITLKALSAGVLLDEQSMARSRIASSLAASSTASRIARSDSISHSAHAAENPVAASPVTTSPVATSPVATSPVVATMSPAPRSRSPSATSGSLPSPQSSQQFPDMAASIMTTDADRFADAEDEDHAPANPSMTSSATSGDFGQQSLYGDESILQFGVDNGVFDTNIEGEESPVQSRGSLYGLERSNAGAHQARAVFSGSNSLPGRLPDDHGQIQVDNDGSYTSKSQPMPEHVRSDSHAGHRDENVAIHSPPSPENTSTSDRSTSTSPSPASSSQGDLAESKLFSHEEAESMYMSAIDDGSSQSSRSFHMPGAWDTSSVTSNDSDRIYQPPTSAAPASLDPIVERDDGCETPRPGSRIGADPATPSEGKDDLSTKAFVPLLDIDTISAWVPGHQTAQDVDHADPLEYSDQPSRSKVAFADDSIFHDVPGAFSQYAASTARSRPSASIMRESRRLPTQHRSAMPSAEAPKNNGAERSSHEIEVSVGNVRLQVDVETVHLAMRLVKLIQQVFGASSAVDTPKEPSKGARITGDEAESDPGGIALKFSMESLRIALLKEVSSQSVATNKPMGALRHAEWDSNEIFLQLQGRDLSATCETKRGSPRANLKIGTFSLGFNDGDILSFRPGTGLDETTMDITKPIETDISVAYRHESGDQRIEVSTLPINVSLDVQKLDDTFASYGGFSGVLKIGNHIKSTCILPPPTSKNQPTPKVVPDAEVEAPFPKVDARFAGLNFALQGETCSLLLETSTIRTSVRKGGVRLSIKHTKVTGPHMTSSAVLSNKPPLDVEIDGVRLDYAFIPAEADLSDLLSLITPTDFKYEADDDILIDTLLSQRRKGSLVKVRVQNSVRLAISDLDGLKQLEALGQDVSKLSSVAKLLPDDERPGILAMIELADCKIDVMVNDRIGQLTLHCSQVRVAHVGLPALLALSVRKIEAERNGSELVVTEVTEVDGREATVPMIMARWLGDDMEPTLKVKLFNLVLDYRVTTIMALLDLSEDCTADDVALGMASSVATIKRAPSPEITRQSSTASEKTGPPSRPMNLDLLLRDCAIGLNPHKSRAKALLVLSDTRFTGSLVQDEAMTACLDVRKASLLVIDDVDRLQIDETEDARPSHAELGTPQVHSLCRWGFVSVGTTSKARAIVKITETAGDGPRAVDVEFKNDLFVMGSCADSTQTLISVLGGLAPPQPPSKEIQYRTKVEPVMDMMASLVGDNFKAPAGEHLHQDQEIVVDDDDQDLHFAGSLYDPSHLPLLDDMTEESIEESMIQSQERSDPGEPTEELQWDEDFFGQSSPDRPAAQAWNSRKNEYIESSEVPVVKSPLTLRVKDVHFIWNLYDGYDWPRTREKLGQKLEEVQQRAQERRERGYDEDDGMSIEEDLLFGSVYIALPVNNTPEENRRQINRAMRGGDDTASETSYATTTASRATARPRSRGMRLKLERGRRPKITFELKGISADVVVFPPGSGETQNSVDVRVGDLEVNDHVPSSTWNKFVTYDMSAGERPLGSPMIHLDMLTVRPVVNLAASELVIRVSVLPLRLHVDQDALDFITRFFEFKDDRVVSKEAPGEQPFIQRLEVRTVKLKLDYKPKKVDYAGLRSGHTTEFMNFLILDCANITLRRCIVYGISGFDKIHNTLNDIWMPDVKSNQIPQIMAGLAIARPAANVMNAAKSIVTVPMAQYSRDGRILRSAQMGAVAFAKNTTTELLRLGAKISIGTQAMMQTAEGILSPVSPSAASSTAQQDDGNWHDVSSSGASPAEGPKAFSHYADQPIGVRAGLISARRHLQQDFASARDAIIAIPGEVMDSGSATGAAKAVVRHAPVVMLRPFTGVAKATGATLFGAANALDPESARKRDEKYKRH
ncbi:autophagy-related protein 2 [Diplodia corticola]|uniref:Autophagy-related protein 2 n=1 Tax=Diplodia corticola TaxID=236234 RepID=A0A1J9R311_9PEZI|nr:autophagy-related protein 2 [Diplodia corticola]OJD35806.1 autophagy-related protein 2 [Diplodia corticola]